MKDTEEWPDCRREREEPARGAWGQGVGGGKAQGHIGVKMLSFFTLT